MAWALRWVKVVRDALRHRTTSQVDLPRWWRLSACILIGQSRDWKALVLRCVLILTVIDRLLRGFGLPCLNVSLNLQYVAFTEHLGALDKLVADLSSASTIDQSILVLAQLRLKSTDLQVHLALIA